MRKPMPIPKSVASTIAKTEGRCLNGFPMMIYKISPMSKMSSSPFDTIGLTPLINIKCKYRIKPTKAATVNIHLLSATMSFISDFIQLYLVFFMDIDVEIKKGQGRHISLYCVSIFGRFTICRRCYFNLFLLYEIWCLKSTHDAHLTS